MKHVICVDVETSGLDPDDDVIVEVGAIVYSLEHRCVIEQFSVLADTGTANKAEAINRIPSAALVIAPALPDVIRRLERLVVTYDHCLLLAHGAEFDRAFLAQAGFDALGTPWVCSMRDVEWPLAKPGGSCVSLALAHGVPVVSAHRALTDCTLLAETMRRVQEMGHDLPAMLDRAMRPKVNVLALTPKPWDVSDEEWTALKAQLVAAGFRYAERPSKGWYGRVVAEEIAALPFAVREVAS